MEQTRRNMSNYVWKRIRDPDDLERLRMSAANMFLDEYEHGLQEGRYLCHTLPDRLPLDNNSVDLGLSSHFLLLYNKLGFDFHVHAIAEMLRVCNEVRVFPLLDLNARESPFTKPVMAYFSHHYRVRIQRVPYEFLKGANGMLVIGKNGDDTLSTIKTQ